MPLSEEELRLLEQMERALAAEDPKFASALQGRALHRTARLRAAAAVVVFVAGLALLLGGAMAQLIWLSIIGFLVMLISATIGLAAWRGRHVPPEPSAHERHHNGAPESRGGFQVIEGGKKQRRHRPHLPGHSTRPSSGESGTFMHRMEQRWQRRRDGYGGYGN